MTAELHDSFSGASAAPFARGGIYARLDAFGVIDVSGDDAGVFLHNQLTNDIQTLDTATARLAGYCTPKGRLLATLLAWRSAQGISLLLSADLAADIQKRLSMFVLRSKARLVDVSADTVVTGLAGDVGGAVATLFAAMPETVYGKTEAEAGTLLRLPNALGRARLLWIARRDVYAAHAGALGGALRGVAPAVFDWLEVHAGVPRVTEATREQFVPQMINLEALGAVNFRKGCYPGQEIVARSQYRGTIKRRAMLASVAAADAAAARPGTELFDAADPGQPCGMVVNAAPNPAGGVDCLVEIKLTARENDAVRLGAPDGPALGFMALPYALPDAR
jgi:folate-binding protein YgfZ